MSLIHPKNRSAFCGDFRLDDAGKQASVCGWVQRRRDLGQLIFIDVRDRSGILQLAFDDSTDRAVFETALSCRAEFTIHASGTIRERSSKNPDLPTGDVELFVTQLHIFTQSETPPFEILDEVNVNETLRMKYRYLDLRRPALQSAISLRHKTAKVTRDFFDEQGFLEIETPILTKSTPEGARDYLVPSRVHPGEFYALPQSPQQYKQLLMLAGYDRYMQIARCFRDEDLRYDRQPEFTQVDVEMSYVDRDDVLELSEQYLKRLFKEVVNVDVQLPLPRLPYTEAMRRYGSDKPDTRFDMELCDLTAEVEGCGFAVFEGAASAGGSVIAINVPGGGEKMSRKEIDALGEFVKTYKAKGLAWLKTAKSGEFSSSFAKFVSPETLLKLRERAGTKDGDLLLCIADADTELAQNAAGYLRRHVALKLDMIPENKWNLLWVTEMPMFESGEDDEGNTRLYAKHHPFTSPMDEDLDKFETAPLTMRAKAYDVVLNGTELGGGSIRIHRPDVQQKCFEALGFSAEEAMERFGHLINAFKYGAPPHGGIAYGLDRIAMWFAGTDNIRDVIAFPKAQNAAEIMTDCPSPVDKKQLTELSIAVDLKPE